MMTQNTTQSNQLYPVANAVASSNPFVDIFLPRDPGPNDVSYTVQKKWLNTVDETFWELKNFISSNGIVTANWVKIGSSSLTESLTGNTGGPVFPDINSNINVVGDGTYIKTVGTPATSTLLIEPAGGLALTYVENTGTATASAGVLNVLGGTAISTSGSGNTITINGTGFAFAYTNVTHAQSPYTVLSTDYYISVDCSGGTVTLNFPNASTNDQIWIVKDRTGNASTNNISITTPGGTVTIDGQTTYKLTSNYGAINLLANATPTYEVF